jgi:twitching motility protein PilT
VVNSLLSAIIRADGDALVMHVGEKPYVVAPSGPVELSSRPLTFEAVLGMLGQLLPGDRRHALDELGAIEHDLPRSSVAGDERFTVVAARGGNDIWIEIRRHRGEDLVEAARPVAAEAPAVEPVSAVEPASGVAAPPEPAEPSPQPEPVAAAPVVPTEAEAVAAEPVAALEPEPIAAPPVVPAEPEAVAAEPVAAPEPEPIAAPSVVPAEPEPVAAAPVAPVESEPAARPPVAKPEVEPEAEPFADFPVLPAPALGGFAASRPARPSAGPPAQPLRGAEAARGQADAASSPTVIVPLARNPIRPETPLQPAAPVQIAGLERLLRLATARGANTLYLMSGLRPSVRLDGEVKAFDGEPVLTAPEVESLLLDLAPERTREALEKGLDTEWMSDVPEVGRFRCQSFRDHRGPGGIFRLIASRPATVEQLGLSREIQSLCAEREGLILVAGPRSSGKSTLISAFVDLINRTRSDYVITIESQVGCAHESRGCLVSQREVRGRSDDVAAAASAALRENPDVLVIEDLRSPEVLALALEAMEAGRLVVGAVPAHTATAAIGRILDQFPADRRARVQLMLAEGLRGVVSQVLVRKSGGGRVAAREVLLNTSAIASLIAEGRISQLPAAIDSGRKLGMVPLNDALAAFVQSGVVDVKDAYRMASDRQGFLAVLRREGVDTSFVEKRA